MPEINELCPNTPFLLVGTEIELRDNTAAIAFEEGEAMAREVGAANYRECSALTRIGVKEVFDEAIHAALTPPPEIPPEDKKRCSLQ